MLRVSAKTNDLSLDLQSINGDAAAAESVPFGAQLLAFAEAVASRNKTNLSATRKALLAAAGSKVLVDAAGVAANFQRMVRIADAIGIPGDDMAPELRQSVRADLNLERFASAQNTLAAGNR